MEVTDIGMYRDGGTILFQVCDGSATNSYRLQTPLMGTPRPLFKNESRLPIGGQDEMHLLDVLRKWLESKLTPDLAVALEQLDRRAWRNLPEQLSLAVPFWRIRHVIRRLEERTGTSED